MDSHWKKAYLKAKTKYVQAKQNPKRFNGVSGGADGGRFIVTEYTKGRFFDFEVVYDRFQDAGDNPLCVLIHDKQHAYLNVGQFFATIEQSDDLAIDLIRFLQEYRVHVPLFQLSFPYQCSTNIITPHTNQLPTDDSLMYLHITDEAAETISENPQIVTATHHVNNQVEEPTTKTFQLENVEVVTTNYVSHIVNSTRTNASGQPLLATEEVITIQKQLSQCNCCHCRRWGLCNFPSFIGAYGGNSDMYDRIILGFLRHCMLRYRDFPYINDGGTSMGIFASYNNRTQERRDYMNFRIKSHLHSDDTQNESLITDDQLYTITSGYDEATDALNANNQVFNNDDH